jgi:hypothetical protein
MYGGVGLLALEGAQFLPVARAAWLPADPEDLRDDFWLASTDVADPDLRLALGAVLLMAAIDNLLNSGMILPLALVIGGMSVWKPEEQQAVIEADATIGG